MAVSLQLDYSLDASGFFTADRRTLLENTLNAIASRLDDTLTAVSSYTYGVSTSNGSRQVTTSVPANTIKIYPFGDALTGSTVGEGSGVWTVSDNNAMRGQQANDYAPDVGFIQFDDDGSTDWYFGSSTSGLTSDRTDFVSVARSRVSPRPRVRFRPADLRSLPPEFDVRRSQRRGGVSQFSRADGRFARREQVTSVMNASSLDGTREDLRDLEWGILKDIGWNVRDAAPIDDSGPHRVYLDFGPAGLWTWSVESAYQQISTSDPEGMAVTNDGTLFVDFGANGLWRWSQGPGFQLISAANPEGIEAGMGASLFIDFGPYGLWYWRSGVMNQLSAANPEGIASAARLLAVRRLRALRAVAVDLRRWASAGERSEPGRDRDRAERLELRRLGVSRLRPVRPVALECDRRHTATDRGRSRRDDRRARRLARHRLRGLRPLALVGSGGLQQLNTANPDKVVAGSDGWLYIDFGPSGLWRWNAVGGYQKLHPNNVQNLATL